ncbi:MAG: hypothetical protein B7Y31_02995 [Novosphingobium sp. 16-62-11]|nr:MAG: hypothetical protein B7Y31_02995 [Novosphingobium sp. 16-62-11]
MPTIDPRIDAHIAKAGEFARPVLERFRALVHREIPDCVEAIKSDEEQVIQRLHAAVERLSSASTASKPKAAPKPVPDMPSSFADALEDAAVRDRFDAMAPGQRREYIEWIVEAKTVTTRKKRIVQAVEWIGEGKTRNWEYQKC